ncbi:MAG: hypothetical protein LBD90_02555 [Bifidobacteriaceae bacterium]|jgi:hypothetical protein|nr:hypothetical protein [Bifidobacteriaceae bacterium]
MSEAEEVSGRANADDRFASLLESAARLQARVPDMVLVGGSAAAIYAGHRHSLDHDHVLADLSQRYQAVLEAVEASDDWATSIKGVPPLTILGMEAGYEAGIRQLRRTRPLETEQLTLPSGARLTVPTEAEITRIKAYLVVQRSAVRDYLDLAALARHQGLARAAAVLVRIDSYYCELTKTDQAVSTVLAERLAAPAPRDTRTLAQLPHYKGLDATWHDWEAVRATLRDLAHEMLRAAA